MKKKSKKELLMAGGLALEILVVLLFLNARINALLDSDMSSEMVLAQLSGPVWLLGAHDLRLLLSGGTRRTPQRV